VQITSLQPLSRNTAVSAIDYTGIPLCPSR